MSGGERMVIRDNAHLFVQRVTVWKEALNDFCKKMGCTAVDTQGKLDWFLKRLHPEFEQVGPYEEFEFPDPHCVHRDNICYKVSVGKYLTEGELDDWRRAHSEGTRAASQG